MMKEEMKNAVEMTEVEKQQPAIREPCAYMSTMCRLLQQPKLLFRKT